MTTANTEGMVWVSGGDFTMGSDEFYPEEAPARAARVESFWIDTHPVTRADFAGFVESTGYVTVAERDLDPRDYPSLAAADLSAGALVFEPTQGPVDLRFPGAWWHFVKGAQWRAPYGDTADRNYGDSTHPVVQVAFEDVQAYASWCGKDLPSQAEWEYAAHGGHCEGVYPWGDDLIPDGRAMANIWRGDFPWRNSADDDYALTSPVGTYPANGYGLYDMIGNVWEWTADWWSDDTDTDTDDSSCCAPPSVTEQDSYDPDMPGVRIPRKVLKGGSHLCAANYCLRYRPAARIPQMIDTGTTHIGFRCVLRELAAEPTAT